MTIIIMAIIGFAAGFAIDAVAAKLAREPYERGEFDDDANQAPQDAAPPLDLGSEAGALAMPLLLTSRSRYRTVVIVAATAALFALAGARYGSDIGYLAIVAVYLAMLIICTATDVLAYRVPNVVTYPAILAAIAVGCILPDANWRSVMAGGLIFGGILFVPSVLTGGAMGMGDVKLAFFVGFALGLTLVVPAMLVMAISGGLAAAILLITRLRGKGDPIPYAPFIAGGAMLVILLQGTAFYSLR